MPRFAQRGERPPAEDLIVLSTIAGPAEASVEELRAVAPGVSEPRKLAFLAAFAALGNRSRAARAAGVSASLVYAWLKDDPAFEAAYANAAEVAAGLLEDEAVRRAAEGVMEPVFQAGRLVGSIRRYSDTLLQFLLRGAMPEKYAERHKVDHTVDVADRLVKARERALGRAKGDPGVQPKNGGFIEQGG
jgi:hypothetical protein